MSNVIPDPDRHTGDRRILRVNSSSLNKEEFFIFFINYGKGVGT